MNGQTIALDGFNQLASQPYDPNGRLVRDGYAYDIRNRLIAAASEPYTYDVIGCRLTKGSTSYLYLGDEEIGSYEDGLCKELQVPELNRAAAIEKDFAISAMASSSWQREPEFPMDLLFKIIE